MQNRRKKRLKVLLSLVVLFTLNALPMQANTPVSIQRVSAYVSDQQLVGAQVLENKTLKENKEQTVTGEMKLFSGDIVLVALLIAVYIFFARSSVNRRKTDF